MSDVAGALTRASGIVAAVVAVVALVSGFLFSARETGARRKPAWWLDLHNGLGGLALGAVGVHILVSLIAQGYGIGVAEVLIPGVASTERAALAWGVLGAYSLAAAVFTTWPRRMSNRRLWRIVHLSSTAGLLLSLVHGYQMGTDATRPLFLVGLVVVTAAVVYAMALRAVDAYERQGRSGRDRRFTSGP